MEAVTAVITAPVLFGSWLLPCVNVHVGLWSSSHSSVLACSLVCRIVNLLLLATSSASLEMWAGLVSSAWAG